jgi:Xaa-Pro dipeptidase
MPKSSSINPLLSRQAKLKSILQSADLNSLILNPGPSMVYLTGLHFHLSERPVLVFISPDSPLTIVLPELEQQKVKYLPYEVQAFAYGEDPSQWAMVFQKALAAAKLSKAHNGVEPRQLRLLEYRLLTEAAPQAHFISAEDSLSRLRMIKDPTELSAMRKAVDIAQRALLATLPQVKIGLTEHELATELTLQLFRAGCDPQVPFSPIVSSGPNSANPHATPSDRKLSPGDLLVIDWGASHDGYISDITRTFAIGDIHPELANIGKVVLEANTAARKIARPGIEIQQVDQAARSVIETAGYGKYFTHRTGHGLGMEGHEEPYIRTGNLTPLEPGMTFTIEPGIYLPDKNGVRIEDDVAITSTGCETLTSLPREISQLV